MSCMWKDKHDCAYCAVQFFDYDKDEPTAKEGDIVKIVIIREDENAN